MRTTSRWPCSTRRRTSASTASAARLREAPRTCGMTQNAHEKLQPSCTFTNARTRSSPTSARTHPIAPTSRATKSGVRSPGSRTTVTFVGQARESVAGEVRAAARHVDAARPPGGPARRLARLPHRLVRDAARVDDGDVGVLAAPPTWPSATSRSRISWTSVCETLQPRKSTVNVAMTGRC